MDDEDLSKIELDADKLYRDEVFSDMRVGAIRRFSPVTAEGEKDDSRPTIYHGQTSLQSAAGPIPINFELEAESLSEAMKQFPKSAKAEAERVMEEIEEIKRQQQQSGQGGGAGGSGGSRIQVP